MTLQIAKVLLTKDQLANIIDVKPNEFLVTSVKIDNNDESIEMEIVMSQTGATFTNRIETSPITSSSNVRRQRLELQ